MNGKICANNVKVSGKNIMLKGNVWRNPIFTMLHFKEINQADHGSNLITTKILHGESMKGTNLIYLTK